MRQVMGWTLLLAAPAVAQPVAVPPPASADDQVRAADGRTVEALNRAILDRDGAIDERNARAAADFQKRRSAYEAALAENAKAKATTEAAERRYQADRARYDAAVADWQAGTARAATTPRPQPVRLADSMAAPADAPETAAGSQKRMVCKTFMQTGSLVKTYRTCKPKREWENERTNFRAPATTGGSCQPGAKC